MANYAFMIHPFVDDLPSGSEISHAHFFPKILFVIWIWFVWKCV